MNGQERLGRAGRVVIMVIGAVVAGIAGVASEAFLASRGRPKGKDAYAMLDEERAPGRR